MQSTTQSSLTSQNRSRIIWEGDLKTLAYLYIAPEVEQVFGYAAADWTASASFWQQHIHPDDRADVLAVLTAEHVEPFVLSYRFALANGRFVLVDDHIHPLPQRGQLLGFKEIRPYAEGGTMISAGDAIAFINQTLFVQGTFRERLDESLIALGQALGLTAVYIVENDREAVADRVAVRYMWEGGKTAVLSPAQRQNLTYTTLGIEAAVPQLQGGQVVACTSPAFACVIAPIVHQNEWQGSVLCYAEPANRVWLPVELEAVVTVANLLSAAFHRVRSYEQTQQQLSQTTEQLQAAEALNEIARYLNSTLELDEVLQRTVDALRRYLTNVQSCSLTILEEQGTVMRMRAQWVEKPEYSLLAIGQSRLVADTNSTRRALQTQKPVIITDLEKDTPSHSYVYTRNAVEQGLRSLLYVPIIIHEEPIGLIHVNAWRRSRYFTAEEVALCESVANQAALAIESARLFQAELQRRREAETLSEVAGYLSSTLDSHAILDQAVQAVRRYMVNVHSCLISILDEDGETLVAQAEWFDQPHHSVRRLGDRIKLSETVLTRQVIEARRTVAIEDTSAHPLMVASLKERANELYVSGVCSVLYVPLLSKGTAVGVLHITVWDEPRPFLPQEISLCQGVANQAAAAIENARLYANAQEQLSQRNALLSATTAMSTSLDMATILSRLAEQLVQALDASSAHIVRSSYQANVWQTLTSYVIPEDGGQTGLRQDIPPLFVDEEVNRKVLARLTRQEAYICYRDDPQILPWEQTFLQKRQIRSFVTVPIFVEGRLWGGAVVMESRRQREFVEMDLALAFGMTQQASVAIERANLYAQLQEYADHLAEEVSARTAELQAERDRTLAILESAGEGIILTDVEATILYANPAIEQQTGYKRDELLKQNVRIFSSNQTPTAVNNAMWERILRGETWSGTVVNRRKNGTLYDVSLTITPTVSSNGQINGFVSVQADISRLKELDRLKSEFVSNVSHELRTPLTNIKTYLALVERGRSEKQPHYLKVLNEESDRLGRLIQDLLDLSRLETESLPERIEPSDLKRQLFKQIDAFAVKASTKHISIRLDLPDDLPLLRISDSHLGQLFTNLFGNSIAYIPEHGNVVVQARVVTQGGQQRVVHIRFQDDGPGIPQEERANIFDRFYRGKSTRNRGIPGTGLGLAICREIAERYGGSINLDNEVTVGTTFLVRLPAVK